MATTMPVDSARGEFMVHSTDAPTCSRGAHPEGTGERPNGAEFSSKTRLRPKLDRLEEKIGGWRARLVKQGAAIGLLGVEVRSNGGLGLDKVTSLVVSEKAWPTASSSATFGAHDNLTIVPLMLFAARRRSGSTPKAEAASAAEDDRRLRVSESPPPPLPPPRLANPSSDALGARTKATRRPDGQLPVNGEKEWITNGGFAIVRRSSRRSTASSSRRSSSERGDGVKR